MVTLVRSTGRFTARRDDSGEAKYVVGVIVNLCAPQRAFGRTSWQTLSVSRKKLSAAVSNSFCAAAVASASV